MPHRISKHLSRLIARNNRQLKAARFQLPVNFRFEGMMSQTDRPYISISRDRWKDGEEQSDPHSTVVPLDCCSSLAAFNAYLKDSAWLLPFPDQRKEALREVSKVRDFDRALILEHPGYNAGYNGSFFAFRNGTFLRTHVTGPKTEVEDSGEEVRPKIAFRTQPDKSGHHGFSETYLPSLERLLDKQAISKFAIYAGLAAPALRFSELDQSFGFWLFGPGYSGKSTITRLAASAWGCPTLHHEIEDISLFSRVGLDERLALCNDHPLFLDGADRWFALETDREKLEHVRKLDQVFRHRTERLSGTYLNTTRTILWATARRPVEDLCGNDEAARIRLGDRLYAIPVPVDRPGMAFNIKEDEERTLASFTSELHGLTAATYGVIARRHVAGLLQAADKDEEALRRLIARYTNSFVKRTGARENDGRGYLTACRFGLVYAAACLARSYGALPANLRVGPDIMNVYRRHLSTLAPLPFGERLRMISCDPQTIDLGAGKLPDVSDEAREVAMAYLRRRKTGSCVYVPEDRIYKVFPDWDRIKRSDEVTAALQREIEQRKGGTEHKHWTVKQVLGANRKTERVYCFRLK